ncbi:hypothetical protein [Salinibacterium sp. ZJ77]|uniref:hypothetical protein n=1 Tax=Salinibacterium sp. ZJ77 TaxID=2708337 RepID=UPI001423A2B4|nr:hypothetical protein [Salinibacterium sp. ZJ77]
MTTTPPQRSRAATMSLWLAVGALIVAAIMGGFFIIVGDQANVAGRAWLTLFLVLLFAGAVVLDAQVSDGPNKWYLTASTITNVVIVAVGLMKLWNGWLQGENTSDPGVWSAQFGRLIAVAVLLRLALLVTQLYGLYFVTRARSQVGKITAGITIGMVWIAALVLAVPASFPAYDWPEWWWRIAGAASLVAVVMAVIPVIIRAFEPKPERAAVETPAYQAPAAGYAPAGYQAYQQPVYQQPAAQPAYQPVPPEYQQQAAAPVAAAQPVAPAPAVEVAPAAGGTEAAPAPEGEITPPVPPQ